MAQASLRPPSSLQPRPKAIPTFSSTSVGAVSRSGTPHLSRPSSESRHASPTRSSTPVADSEKAPTALIRRVLCPASQAASDKERPLDEILPPLTSSNGIDQQLYAILSIIVKDVVQTWYSKITPDQTFVEEVAKIVAHCTRALESRIRDLDIESLILDEIPGLFETHVHAYRVANQAAHSEEPPVNPRITYHDLNPHPALSPTSKLDNARVDNKQEGPEADYRQSLVQASLAVLLPTEDLENACLRTLVADVIAEAILGNSIGGKISENWYIWSSISKAIRIIHARVLSIGPGTATVQESRSRLEKFGLLSEKDTLTAGNRQYGRSTISSMLWHALQLCHLAITFVGLLLAGLFAAMKRSGRSQTRSKSLRSVRPSIMEADILLSSKPRPIVEFRIFTLISTLADLRHRMPWLVGLLSLSRHHLSRGLLKKVGGTDGLLDQYLHHLLQTYLLSSHLLPDLLALARQTLFPHNSLPPPAAPAPSPEQVREIKHACAQSILSLLPPSLCRRLWGADQDGWAEEVEVELDVWDDGWMNKHLAYKVLDLIIVRVLPEVAEKGVQELMEARLGEQSYDSGLHIS